MAGKNHFAIMRTAKIKSVASMANLEKHCDRSKLPPNADEKRTALNRTIIQDELSLPERFAKITEGQKIRKNAVLGVEVMMTYSPLALMGQSELDQWVQANQRWLEAEFGKENVVRLWLHMDESTPHLHAFVIPIDGKGKLNCRAFLGGADKLSAMQDRYGEAMKEHGLDRGLRGSKAHHTTVRAFYRAIGAVKDTNLTKPITKSEKRLIGGDRTVTEDIRDYYKRANEAYKERGYDIVDLKTKLEQEKRQHAGDKFEIENLKNENEHWKSMYAQQKPKAEAWDTLAKGVKNFDKDRTLTNAVNGVLEAQRELEKAGIEKMLDEMER